MNSIDGMDDVDAGVLPGTDIASTHGILSVANNDTLCILSDSPKKYAPFSGQIPDNAKIRSYTTVSRFFSPDEAVCIFGDEFGKIVLFNNLGITELARALNKNLPSEEFIQKLLITAPGETDFEKIKNILGEENMYGLIEDFAPIKNGKAIAIWLNDGRVAWFERGERVSFFTPNRGFGASALLLD